MISSSFWHNRRVLVTGHTGFKGAWTALILHHLGAKVHGFALPPESSDGLFIAAHVEQDVDHGIGDIRDLASLQHAFARARPQVVLHLAAQSLVRRSYKDPVGTYDVNVMGTVNVLECARHSPDIQAIVVVTSDKCYANMGQIWGYREGEMLGGHDPYSNSKACAELVTAAYRSSFFAGQAAPFIASARAGNVIGGGDFAEDRLIPDAMRAFLTGNTLRVRYPHAVRPWQHVFDPTLGYLLLAERLATEGRAFAEAWNFGPAGDSEISVAQMVEMLVRAWADGAQWSNDERQHAVEAAYLKLDTSKARARLGWRPLVDLDRAVQLTVDWYKALQRGADLRRFTLGQVEALLSHA